MNSPSLSRALGAAYTLLHLVLSGWGTVIIPHLADQDRGLEWSSLLLIRGARVLRAVSLLWSLQSFHSASPWPKIFLTCFFCDSPQFFSFLPLVVTLTFWGMNETTFIIPKKKVSSTEWTIWFQCVLQCWRSTPSYGTIIILPDLPGMPGGEMCGLIIEIVQWMSSIVLVWAEENSRGEYLPRLARESQLAGPAWHGRWGLMEFSQENGSALLSMDKAPGQARSSTGQTTAELVALCEEHRLGIQTHGFSQAIGNVPSWASGRPGGLSISPMSRFL